MQLNIERATVINVKEKKRYWKVSITRELNERVRNKVKMRERWKSMLLLVVPMALIYLLPRVFLLVFPFIVPWPLYRRCKRGEIQVCAERGDRPALQVWLLVIIKLQFHLINRVMINITQLYVSFFYNTTLFLF